MAIAQEGAITDAEATPRLALQLEAAVSPICGAFTTAGSGTVVDFGDLANIPEGEVLPIRTVAADIAYICNQPNGFLRTVSSQNGGRLVRAGSAGGPGNEIIYLVGGTGSGLTFGLQPLTAPIVSNGVGAVFLLGSSGPLQVQVRGVRSPVSQNGVFGTTVFAGSYVDTLTIAVTAN